MSRMAVQPVNNRDIFVELQRPNMEGDKSSKINVIIIYKNYNAKI